MQNTGPPPLFRSDTQRRLLVELLFERGERRTLSELARALEVDPTTVMREIDRLAEGGLIVEQRVGRARTVQIDETSPYTEPIRQILGVARRSTDDTTEPATQRRSRFGRHDHRPLPSSRRP